MSAEGKFLIWYFTLSNINKNLCLPTQHTSKSSLLLDHLYIPYIYIYTYVSLTCHILLIFFYNYIVVDRLQFLKSYSERTVSNSNDEKLFNSGLLNYFLYISYKNGFAWLSKHCIRFFQMDIKILSVFNFNRICLQLQKNKLTSTKKLRKSNWVDNVH